MKKLFGVIFFLVMFLAFNGTVEAKSCTDTQTNVGGNTSHTCVDLKGYAWGADNSPFGGVGWINMNNTATGSNTAVNSTQYWVEFDRDDKGLRGYAWSEKYGYIRFGGFTDKSENDENDFPSAAPCENGTESTTNCNVHLVASGAGYQLVGYARFCFVYKTGCDGQLRPTYERGGYDGWIAFKGTNFAVSYQTANGGKFQGYAWGGGSGDATNSNYGSGSGWIKMDPANGGVTCAISAPGDCLDDNDKPVVTLSASPSPAKYNEDVTLTWSITNANGCTADTSSSPSNSTWDNYTLSGYSGNKNIGKITASTTFTVSCTTNTNKKGSADAVVDLTNYTPQVDLTAPATKIYGENVQLDYEITNIPFGCSAQLYNNSSAVGSPITINGNGTTNYTKSDSITVNNLTATANWELKCTDSTPPSPSRVGSDTAKTTVSVPTPTVTISAESLDTGSTTTFPCSNTGAEITYKAKDVKPGSCKAWFNNTQSFSDWGSSTTINEDGSDHTITTGAITGTGTSNYNSVFYLRCQKLDGTAWAAGHFMNHSCTAGSLSMNPVATCVTPSERVDFTYTGSGITSGTCQMSWRTAPNNKINQSAFNLRYVWPASMLTVGQTYTYTVSGCQESAYPNNTPLSESIDIEVQNTCTTTPTNQPCTGPRCSTNGGSPTFKEF